jgi:hypothetical protein
MGFDVHGRKPSHTDGEYFRASIWTWRPIHYLLCSRCQFLGDTMLTRLGANDGAGPNNQAMCNRIANEFQDFLDNEFEATHYDAVGNDHWTPPLPEESEDMLVDKNTGQFITRQQQRSVATRDPNWVPVYSITRSKLEEWINFLRACGGFSAC